MSLVENPNQISPNMHNLGKFQPLRTEFSDPPRTISPKPAKPVPTESDPVPQNENVNNQTQSAHKLPNGVKSPGPAPKSETVEGNRPLQ